MPPKEQEMFDKEFPKQSAGSKELTDWFEAEKLDIKQYLSKHYILREDLLREVGRKSVEELKEKMGSAYNDLSVQVAYKEGYNKRASDIKNFINKQE